MPNTLKAAAAMGILLLAVALLVPTLANSVNDNEAQTFNLSVNETQELTDKLQVELTDTQQQAANDNATVKYTNLDDLSTNKTTLNESTNDKLNLSGDTITVQVKNISSNAAQVRSEYPPMFGWNNGARTFYEESDTIIIGLAVAIVIVLFGVIVRVFL